jgi:hypothetical protein
MEASLARSQRWTLSPSGDDHTEFDEQERLQAYPVREKKSHRWEKAAFKEAQNQSTNGEPGKVLHKAIAHADQAPAELEKVVRANVHDLSHDGTYRDDGNDPVEL